MEKFIDKLENLPQQQKEKEPAAVVVSKPKKAKEIKMGFDTETEEKDFCEV